VPDDDFDRPLSNAASAPVAEEFTLPEQEVELAHSPMTPMHGTHSITQPRRPPVPAWSTANTEPDPGLLRVELSSVVEESDVDWHEAPEVVQSAEPVLVFAAADAARPVVGLVTRSPAPVPLVFDSPCPAHPVAPAQSTVADAWLDPGRSLTGTGHGR